MKLKPKFAAIYIPSETRDRLRIYADENGMKIKSAGEKAIREFLDDYEDASRIKRRNGK